LHLNFQFPNDAEIYIYISVPPDRPSITESGIVKATAVLNAEETFTFTCTKGATGEVPDGWAWYKQNIRMFGSVAGAVFSKRATVNDAGWFTCKAFKGVAASISSSPLVITVNGTFAYLSDHACLYITNMYYKASLSALNVR
jgi:hypothetical protein